MKKIVLITFIVFTLGVNFLNAQCACAATDYGSINVTCWSPGQSGTIATNIYAGERSLISNTVAGAVYRVSSCGASYDTQLTIYTTSCGFVGYQDDNGPACTGLQSSIDITSPGGNLYAVLNQFPCATNSTNTTVSVTLISLPANANPAFGANQWNIHAYDGRSRDNLGSITYRGTYSRTSLGFNTITDYAGGTAGTPSSASGYSGCPVGVDNHTVVAKRQGFPCGVYEVSILNHDDEAILYVNGANVWSANCCQFNGVKWTGYLDATSTIEARYAEGGGGASMGVGLTLLSSNTSTGAIALTNNPICSGATDGAINVSSTLYHNETFSTLPAGFTLYQNASLTGGRIQLTPASNGQQGFVVINNTGHNATSFRSTFNITNVGADGYCFSYGANLAGSLPATNSGVEETGVGNNLSLGLDYYENRVYLRYAGVNIINIPYTLNNNYAVIFFVDEVGRASLTLNGAAVFTNVFISGAYYTANKSAWQFAFGARTGGVNGLHSIDNLFIGEYEYSSNGGAWQTNPLVAGLSSGTNTISKRLIQRICTTGGTTIGSKTIDVSSTVSANVIAPNCFNGTDGAIELTVSGAIHGARVVKIVQLDNEPFNTNEIQAFQVGTNTNVALASLGGVPAMSSALNAIAYPTSWLNDGNTANGIGAHTNTGVGQWQKVSWEAPVTLDRIVIWNRSDCCNQRLDNIRLEIYGDLAETNLLLSQVVDADNGVGTSFTFSDINFNSSPTSTYLWSNSATTEDISGLASGNYNVTVTDDYGCVTNLTGITVPNPAQITLVGSVGNAACPTSTDGTVDVTVTNDKISAQPPLFSNLAIWTKANAGVVKNTTNDVIQWQDLSGNDNHFYTTFGAGVQEVTGAIGGNNAIRFSANNIMETAQVINGNYTVIVVGKLNGGTNQRLVSSGTRNWLLGWWGGRRNQFFSEGWINNTVTTDALTTPYIFTGTGNIGADSYSFYTNGSLVVTNNGGSQPPGSIALGGWGTGNTELSNGDVAEVIVYNRVLTADERLKVEKYLADKYSISGPTGVPTTYSWSPGGATTEDITAAGGTYTLTATDASGCSNSNSFIIGVDGTESTEATAANTSNDPICTGGSTTLTFTGGGLGSGANWVWYSGSCGGTFVGNGTSIVVSPTVSTDYYVRAEGDCNDSNCKVVTVNVTSASNNASLVNATSVTATEVCVEAPWTYYANPSTPSEYIFAIKKNGNTFDANVEITDQAGTAPYSSVGGSGPDRGTWLISRYWNVTLNSGSISSPVDIRFFVDPAEVTAAEAAAIAFLGTTPVASNLVGLTFFKTLGTAYDPSMMSNGNFTFTPAYLSHTTGTANGITYYELTGLTSFSGGTGGFSVNDSGATLPVELLGFDAQAIDNTYVRSTWTTATEINNHGFELMRSTDGESFETIAWIEGNGNSNQIINYVYEDYEVTGGMTYYYQLKQIDFNGMFELFNIVSATLYGENLFAIGNVVPNPSKGNEHVSVEIRVNTAQSVNIGIFNHLGKQVGAMDSALIEGTNSLKLFTGELASGTYFIHFEGVFGRETRKLVIVK